MYRLAGKLHRSKIIQGMENLKIHNHQTDEFSEKSEEGYLLPAPDACTDRIVKACRYGLYAFILIALAAVLFSAAKG